MKGFFLWANSSLLGHICVFQLSFAIPMGALMAYLNYRDGTLTVGWAARLFGCSIAIAMIIAILVWSTITVPRAKR